MKRRLGGREFAVLATSVVIVGPSGFACAPGPTYDEWAATDGAAGRINLDAVQEAFKTSENPTDFETRVNEIYEGDNLVLIRSRQDNGTLILEGYEDLDGNGEIDTATDDELFSIVKQHDNHELRGHGANGYYRSSFGPGNFLFTYLLVSSMTGPRYYSTPYSRVGTMRANRTNYRAGSTYKSQVSRNTNYFGKQKNFHGSKYSNAGRNISKPRSSYLASSKASGAFKASKAGVRSQWGSSASRRSSGGFRGGGGAQSIIG